MIYENEITVEIETTQEEILKELKRMGFSIKDEYDVNDIYMINKEIDKLSDPLICLKNCILLRKINNLELLTYKYKEYNDKREIIKQGKINCKIESVEKVKELFEAINYEEFIRINDHIIVVANETDEFAIESVNNKHCYIELEQNCDYIDKKYKNLDDMKNTLNRYNILFKNDDYFVKKAEIEIKEKYGNQFN